MKKPTPPEERKIEKIEAPSMDEILELEKERAYWNNQIQNSLIGGVCDNYGFASAAQANAAAASGAQISNTLAKQQYAAIVAQKKAAGMAIQLNTLLWRGEQLPENWRGAEIEYWRRTVADGRWCVTFVSQWADERIYIYFDTEEYSGAQVNEMAETYMLALNQRRVG